MRLALSITVMIVFAGFFVLGSAAFACQCGIGFHEKNAWENAKNAANTHGVIFEGTPVKFELRWDLLDAKEGELICTDGFQGKSWTERTPHMVVTFHVAKAYKGNLGSEVRINTGLGGGDCAAVYTPGLNYLVYADGQSEDHLFVSMCTPGGWIDGGRVATDLRYLRRERPIAADLARILYSRQAGWDKQREQQQRRAEEFRKKYDAATGRICGRVVHDDAKDHGEGSIAFLSTLGYSPVLPPYAERQEDGSFCSPHLGPGKYYIYFVQQDDQGAAALYYPGVRDVVKATPVEVRAGQTEANIRFHVTKQASYTVRGFVSADDRSAFDSQILDPSISLIRSDGDMRVIYAAKTKVRVLPRALYFKFENVVPGRYFAFVQGRSGWMTRKVVVDVTTHSKFITLDLVRKR